ncbi:hypothetical protein N2152v2_004867 [Parachlorella kessleri]
MSSLVSKPVVVAKPSQVARRPLAAQAKPRLVFVRGTAPDKSAIQEAIKDAEETAAAWDTVEELSAAASHAKDAAKANPSSVDPLEKYCEDQPDADECRVFDD